jgi:hypothetical protein
MQHGDCVTINMRAIRKVKSVELLEKDTIKTKLWHTKHMHFLTQLVNVIAIGTGAPVYQGISFCMRVSSVTVCTAKH